MITSEQTANIFAALAAAQAAMGTAKKDNNNPAFKSKYADLASHVEAIRPAFAAQKLAVLQELTSEESGVKVKTRIAHASGEWVEFGAFFVPVDKHNAHGYGSACSYARRYALSAAVGTIADDDDGNAAVESKPYQLPKPVGYDNWLADLEMVAKNAALSVFRDNYKSSAHKFRAYLEETDKPALDRMVETAKKNPATAA